MRDKRRKDYVLFAVFAVLFFMTRTNSISLLIVLFGTVFLTLPKKKRYVIGAFIALILAILQDYLLQGIMSLQKF